MDPSRPPFKYLSNHCLEFVAIHERLNHLPITLSSQKKDHSIITIVDYALYDHFVDFFESDHVFPKNDHVEPACT